LLPGIQLIISLCHSTTFDSSNSAPINDHDHVLEHSLHQLLREVHYKNTHHPFPHPASGPLGPSKKTGLAGPMAFDRYELIEMTKTQTLLEQIIAQAQHIFMRKRTQYVLDTLARDVKDPQITSHWNAMNSPTMSCVKINISTHGYDAACRTSLVIHVKERSLKCVCRDGRVMIMSYEPQELRDLILCQISQHQCNALHNLAKCMAWQILSNSNHLGIGSVEPLGNASSVILASPNSDRIIAVQVRCDPQIDVKVYIAQSPRKDFFPGSLVQGRLWENLGGQFKEVRFDKMEGRNFLNKMEFLMASLTSS
jgi:mediator of RNA polymerase II transcription subunit 17